MVREHTWFVADTEQGIDLLVHVQRKLSDEVARFGPGLGGRWWVLLEPRRDPTPPHSHSVRIRFDPDHPARCRSPGCWTKTVIACDGTLTTLDDRT